jgi:uncharacterized membrane protein YkvA (DUF1232 family)
VSKHDSYRTIDGSVLGCPIDLVPAFLPGIGYADDAIAPSIVLRHITGRAGPTRSTATGAAATTAYAPCRA